MKLIELGFDWDLWNVFKSLEKHGVTVMEAESAFYDPKMKHFRDLKNSKSEEQRYIVFGMSMESRLLVVCFTIRNNKIRVISARPANKKERGVYEL